MNHGQARQRFYNSFPLTTQPRSIRVIDIIGELPTVTSSEAGPVNEAGIKLRMGGEEAMHPSPAVRMRVINLNDKPAFTALSYVWGDSNDTSRAFEIVGGELPVTKNCWAALSQLRKNFGPLTIWVDSLCINQSDDDERLSQVGLMGDIYSSAAYVYIWLGDSNSASNKAMAYFRTCGLQNRLRVTGEMTYLISHEGKIPFRLLSWHYRQNWRAMSPKSLAQRTLAPMETLNEILSRPWIRRIWTLQEAMLAKRPILCCGSETLCWRSFSHAICYLHHVETFFLGERLESSLAPWKTLVLLWYRFNTSDSSTNRHDSGPHHGPFDRLLPRYCHLLRAILKLHRRLLILASNLTRLYVIVILLVAYTTLVFYILTLVFPPQAENETGDYQGLDAAWVALVVILSVLGVSFHLMIICDALTSDISRWSKDKINRAHTCELEAVLYEICQRQASDPRDKYYGMRSVLTQLGVPDLPAIQGTVEDVHRGLFQALYARTKSLGLLLCCGNGNAPYSCSWVPRWDSDFTAGWFDAKHVLGSAKSASPKPSIHFRGSSQLVVTATIHTTVVEVSGLLYQENDERDPHATMERRMRTVHAWADEGVPIREGKYLHNFVGISTLLENLVCEAMVEYRRQFLRVKANEEEKVGNGPEQARVGDSIALVPGFSLPLILRRKALGYTFEFIGIAELHVTAEDFQKDLQELVIE